MGAGAAGTLRRRRVQHRGWFTGTFPLVQVAGIAGSLRGQVQEGEFKIQEMKKEMCQPLPIATLGTIKCRTGG